MTRMQERVVLYVEDEENDVLLLRLAFEQLGISNPLKHVQNGKDAIDYLAGEGCYADRQQYPFPSLVLLDIKLPLKSGFDVLRWMRQDISVLKKLPVVMFTSSDSPQDVELAYELGANGYLIKLPNPSDWKKRVQVVKEFWLVHNSLPLSLQSTPPSQGGLPGLAQGARK